MKKNAATDIAIFGGGVAGLWLLNRLRQLGYSALLFESGALGGGQTNKAQGIIHGGMKYALQGVLTTEAQSMVDLPKRWQACLEGKGAIDLSHVPILSPKHYLWAPGKFTSKLSGFLASKTLSSEVTALTRDEYPEVFRQPAFKGHVFALNEMVIDVPVLVRELAKANQDALFKIEPLSEEELQFDEQGKLLSATVYMAGQALEIRAQQFIFTAGVGNEVIVKKLRHPGLAMQRRPLHMVLVKMPEHYPLYAHCVGLGMRPRLTVTTHYLHDGSSVWYLGGALAEEGIERDRESQIEAARHELKQLFPRLDLTQAEITTFMIDRAELLQRNGVKPESSSIKTVDNMTIAWPTKLALAPKLADDIIQQLQQHALQPQWIDTRELRSWPMPIIAKPIWEEAFCKSVV